MKVVPSSQYHLDRLLGSVLRCHTALPPQRLFVRILITIFLVVDNRLRAKLFRSLNRSLQLSSQIQNETRSITSGLTSEQVQRGYTRPGTRLTCLSGSLLVRSATSLSHDACGIVCRIRTITVSLVRVFRQTRALPLPWMRRLREHRYL